MRTLLCFGILSLVAADTAHACSQLACQAPYVAPSAGATIPAGAPALFVTQSYNLIDGSMRGDPSELTLRDTLGNAIDIDVVPLEGPADVLVKPRTQLAPGEYRLTHVDHCNFNGPPETRDTLFTVDSTGSWPTDPGTVGVTQRRVHITDPISSCDVARDAVVAQIAVSPSSSAQPWAPVARYVLSVDGKEVGRTRFGDNRPIEVYASCDPAKTVGGIGEGPHHGTVTMELAGSTKIIPKAGFDFSLVCNPLPDVQEAGCSVGGHARSGALALFLLVLLVVGLRRRA